MSDCWGGARGQVTLVIVSDGGEAAGSTLLGVVHADRAGVGQRWADWSGRAELSC